MILDKIDLHGYQMVNCEKKGKFINFNVNVNTQQSNGIQCLWSLVNDGQNLRLMLRIEHRHQLQGPLYI